MAVDLVGPFPESESGNSYIMVVGDYFSRWMEAFPIPNQEATTVADKLVDEVFLRYSAPEQLHSDQGRQFESRLITEICKLLQIKKTRTTPYHPQSDGLVERFNRTLLAMLATCAKDNPLDWEKHLRKVVMAYNTSVQASTGYTPFFLMFGRQARIPVDVLYGAPNNTTQSPSMYASTLRKQMNKAFALARKHSLLKHSRQKEIYDRKVHGKPYQKGDYVWLHSPMGKREVSKKLYHPWSGPYKVVKKLSEANYRIEQLKGRRIRKIVHFDRLKPCPKSIRVDEENQSPTPEEPAPDHDGPCGSQNSGSPEVPPVGQNLQIVEDDDEDNTFVNTPIEEAANTSEEEAAEMGETTTTTSTTLPSRYPRREHRAPSRYSDYVPISCVEDGTSS